MDPCYQSTPAFAAGAYLLPTCRLRPLSSQGAGAAAAELACLDPWLTLGYSPAGLARYLQKNDVSLHRFEIQADGQPAGVVCCRHPWLLGPLLELLAIYPPFQGRGLGREILAWLAGQGAFANLWTTVSAFNQRGRKFYRKNGFRQVGPLPDLVRAGYTELLLRKSIGLALSAPQLVR